MKWVMNRAKRFQEVDKSRTGKRFRDQSISVGTVMILLAGVVLMLLVVRFAVLRVVMFDQRHLTIYGTSVLSALLRQIQRQWIVRSIDISCITSLDLEGVSQLGPV